jgi:hypothetical protein
MHHLKLVSFNFHRSGVFLFRSWPLAGWPGGSRHGIYGPNSDILARLAIFILTESYFRQQQFGGPLAFCYFARVLGREY